MNTAAENIASIYGPDDDTAEEAEAAERARVRDQQRADMAQHACLACGRHPATHATGGEDACGACGLGDAIEALAPAPGDIEMEHMALCHSDGSAHEDGCDKAPVLTS